jgi:hypothetical protein
MVAVNSQVSVMRGIIIVIATHVILLVLCCVVLLCASIFVGCLCFVVNDKKVFRR